jgi:hypothetical protein
MTNEICHEQWAQRLKQAHFSSTKHRRGICLPDKSKICFSGTPSLLRVHLCGVQPRKGVLGNMQHDGSAFESWALAFRAWCGVERIEIAWDAPAVDSNHPLGNPHYNRFLYRVDRFCSMFTWAQIHDDNAGAAKWTDDRHHVLNRQSKPRDDKVKNKPEAELEGRLFAGRLKLPAAFNSVRLDRQFPVGLFVDTVAERNAIFPAKASAIDLWGTQNDCAYVFELKAAENQKMGIVSELVFYANMFRDVIRGVFERPGDKSFAPCRRVVACFLGQESDKKKGAFHPLLDDGKVIRMLNEAEVLDGVSIHFCSAVIDTEGQQMAMRDRLEI